MASMYSYMPLSLKSLEINKNTIGNGKIGPITQILRETYIKISKHNSI